MTSETKDTAVLLCDCGKTLRDRLDFDLLQNNIKQLPQVKTVKCTSKLCLQDDCDKLIKSLDAKQTPRIVIAACDRDVFDSNLRKAMAGQKLNDGLLWCTNIREHCAWSADNSKKAAERATDTIAAAVRRTALAESVKSKKITASQDVLIIGSGVAAMQTAVSLSKLAHKVTIVEKTENLGGLAAQTPQLYGYVAQNFSDAESTVSTRVEELLAQITGDKKINVRTSTSVKSVQGQLGNFTAEIGSNGTGQKLTAGAIVLAVGGPATNPALTKLMQTQSNIPKKIAIVLDILGQQTRSVSAQVLSAAELLAGNFKAEVKIYCSSIRVAAAGLENLYRRTREAGVVIIKYDSPPAISNAGDQKTIRVREPIIGQEITEQFDLIITADAAPSQNNGSLTNLLRHLRKSPEGALQYDSVWLLPAKTNQQGIFVVGSARGNSELREAQNDGLAAANQIHELLKDKQIEVLDDAAVVDSDKCVLCLTCMRVCPHGAIDIDLDNKVASPSELTCQRCGICASQCPAGAIQLPRYTDTQIAADIGIESKNKKAKTKTVIFACENSAYPAATAASNNAKWKQDIRLIRVPCAGKVDSRDVLKAFEAGAQKVIILACHLENCQYISGSTQADSRIRKLNDALEKAGVDKKQVSFKQLASVEPGKFLDCIKE